MSKETYKLDKILQAVLKVRKRLKGDPLQTQRDLLMHANEAYIRSSRCAAKTLSHRPAHRLLELQMYACRLHLPVYLFI